MVDGYQLSDREVVVELVHAGAREVLRAGVAEVHAKGGPADLVSQADLMSQQAMIAELHRWRPGDGIWAEENQLRRAGERTWLLDPLDGTLGWVRGTADWCVAAALRQEESTPVAAVYCPPQQRLFLAQAGELHVNGQPVQVAAAPRLGQAVIRTYVASGLYAREDYRAGIAALAQASACLTASFSGSLALASCTLGQLDGWVEYYPPEADKSWDWYPGQALLQAAGGATAEVGCWRIGATSRELLEELAELLV